MGARVLTGLFCIGLLPATIQERPGRILDGKQRVISDDKKLVPSDIIHGAVSSQQLKISTTDHQPYDLLVYELGYGNGISQYGEFEDASTGTAAFQDAYSIPEEHQNGGFSSPESDKHTGGHEQFGTATSAKLEGSKQLETIDTQSYHEEVEPYQVSDFPRGQQHEDDLEQSEVHYHRHRHVHRHGHEQNHLHEHKQEHKHKHGHSHGSRSQHEHKHESQHEHNHQSRHNHNHKDSHGHGHRQEHKHSHRAWHKHGHAHYQEHKHEQSNSHKHEHRDSHKHSHHEGHQHGHHHGHKHGSEHTHDHHRHEHKHRRKAHQSHKRSNHRV